MRITLFFRVSTSSTSIVALLVEVFLLCQHFLLLYYDVYMYWCFFKKYKYSTSTEIESQEEYSNPIKYPLSLFYFIYVIYI